MELYKLLKIVSEPSRLKILYCLKMRNLCVGELQETLNLSQANVSKHLKILFDNKMVKKANNNQQVFYSLDTHYVSNCLIFNPLMEVFEESEDGQYIKKILDKEGR